MSAIVEARQIAANRIGYYATSESSPQAPYYEKTPASTWLAGVFVAATLTGLEPATTGSTVRYSNQLSYSAFQLAVSTN